MLRSYEALVYTLANRVVSCVSIWFALRKVPITVTAEFAGWPGLLCARFLGVARSVNILIPFGQQFTGCVVVMMGPSESENLI